MSKADEAITHLMQIRDQLAPIAKRLLDIEARMVTAKAVDHLPVKRSLREFTARLLGHEGLIPDETNECDRPQHGLANVR
jgi:hypothetical protein